MRRRVISGVVMGVAAIAVTWWGGWPYALFWTSVAGAVAWEWQKIVAGPQATAAAALAAGVIAASLLVPLLPLTLPTWSQILLLLAWCGLLTYCTTTLVPPGVGTASSVGFLYTYALGLGSILCRGTGSEGIVVIFWLFAVVWGTDIIAYFTGRALGGPKLWPRVSPKKTWSGAFGGLVGGTLAGCVLLMGSGTSLLWQHLALSIAFSVLTQLGDLYESALKRRFDVKDSGKLIPGHGGFMDRLDGFVFAVALAAALGTARNGLDGVPAGLLSWP